MGYRQMKGAKGQADTEKGALTSTFELRATPLAC